MGVEWANGDEERCEASEKFYVKGGSLWRKGSNLYIERGRGSYRGRFFIITTLNPVPTTIFIFVCAS